MSALPCVVLFYYSVPIGKLDELGNNHYLTCKPRLFLQLLLKIRGGWIGMMASSLLHRESVMWWKNVLFHLFSLTLIFSQLLYNRCSTGKNVPKKPLWNSQLIKQQRPEDSKAKWFEKEHVRMEAPCPGISLDRLRGQYFLPYIPLMGKTEHHCHACVECSILKRKKKKNSYENQGRQRKETLSRYEQCREALCVVPRFEIWHSMNNV